MPCQVQRSAQVRGRSAAGFRSVGWQLTHGPRLTKPTHDQVDTNNQQCSTSKPGKAEHLLWQSAATRAQTAASQLRRCLRGLARHAACVTQPNVCPVPASSGGLEDLEGAPVQGPGDALPPGGSPSRAAGLTSVPGAWDAARCGSCRIAADPELPWAELGGQLTCHAASQEA